MHVAAAALPAMEVARLFAPLDDREQDILTLCFGPDHGRADGPKTDRWRCQ